MNTAEKIASTYLRLNGFLLLPQFTVFSKNTPKTFHNHVDLLALRPAGSREVCFDQSLPRDDALFQAIFARYGLDADGAHIGVIAEVRTNDDRDTISEEHLHYAANFLGGIQPIRMTFFETPIPITTDEAGVAVGLIFALRWIHRRICWMNENLPLKKTPSWTLSEEFLADILSLRRIERLLPELQAIEKQRNATTLQPKGAKPPGQRQS